MTPTPQRDDHSLLFRNTMEITPRPRRRRAGVHAVNAAGWTISIIAIATALVLAVRWERSARREPR